MESSSKKRIALVFGSLPSVDEIDQFQLIQNQYHVDVVAPESICGYLTQTSRFQDLQCVALADYDDNTTYLPGLEKVLGNYDIVIVKERLGLYAYQAVKAKWKKHFRLLCWVDNATPFPAEDISQMRTVREEITNAADGFLVQSEAAKTALMVEGVEAERIYSFKPYITKPVKRTKQNKVKAIEQLGLKDGDFVLAYFGQVEWEEGLLDLAHAVKQATQNNAALNRRLKIVFCGIGSFSTQLRDRFIQLGMDRKTIYVAPSRDAFETLWLAADAVYVSSLPGRDRIDLDPYRILGAMVNEVPVIATRNSVVEEYVGKHRIDFCMNSIDSLVEAITKAESTAALTHDITKKNKATYDKNFSQEKVRESMLAVFKDIEGVAVAVNQEAIDSQVTEVENKVNAKQYLAAIDMIEGIFASDQVPVHHKANLYRLVGDCFTKLGDPESGKNAYIQATELDPYAAKAFIGLGTVGLVKGSHDIAVIHFQKAVSLAPEDEMANLGLGLAFQGLEELEESNKWVRKALQINPENQAGLFTLVKLAYDRNKFSDAEQSIGKYLTLHPHDHHMLYTLAGILYKNGQNDEALAKLQDIISVDPLDARAHSLAKQIRRQQQAQSTSAGANAGGDRG